MKVITTQKKNQPFLNLLNTHFLHHFFLTILYKSVTLGRVTYLILYIAGLLKRMQTEKINPYFKISDFRKAALFDFLNIL